MNQRFLVAGALLMAIVTASGCGRHAATNTHSGTVSGRVLRDGKPIAEARVVAWYRNETPKMAAEVATDQAGRFKLERLPSGVKLEIVITKELSGHWLIDHKGLIVTIPAMQPSLQMGDIAVGAMAPPLGWSGPTTGPAQRQ